MIHAIAYVVFILLFSVWLGGQLKRTYSLKDFWPWIFGAVLVGLIGSALSNVYDDKFGNFLLHASGGISSVLLFIYLFKTLHLSFRWQITTLLLFAFVCTLGVLNELAEYMIESLGLGTLSFDTHDTWRDLVANTAGAIIAWMIYGLIGKSSIGKPDK
jgi:hypothetical protein